MSTWPFHGAALALCASVLLAGCTVAPQSSEESVGMTASELDQRDVDESDGSTDVSGDDGDSIDGVVAGPGDLHEPEPLPWRDHLIAPESAASPRESAYAQRAAQPEPEPLPWQPSGGTPDVNGGAHESDNAR